MIMARAVAALAACAAAFEQRVCPGDQPTNVSDTIFKERVVVFDEAMGARVVVAGDINKDGRNDLAVAPLANNWIEGRSLLLPAVLLDEGIPGPARPAEFARVAG